MGKVGDLMEITGNMGWRYTRFRVLYELKRKSGLLRKSFPVSPQEKKFITLAEWRASFRPFFFHSREEVDVPRDPTPELRREFEDTVSGRIRFFGHTLCDLGEDYDWLTNPDTGFRYDISRHWSEIEDMSREAGDIKYTWEKSRFSYLYTVIRYDHHFGEDNSEFVFREISGWLDANPLNRGPNYRCSQEISLRMLNWIFALYFYKNSPHLTDDLFGRIMNSVYWQLHHVYHNIDFSRIAVRNNHAITETLALYVVPTIFPWMGTGKWKRKGKAWFEQEIEYQIYGDGTYLQFSMNYQRVVVQLLTWAIRLAEVNGERFADHVYQRAYKSINFLYQCQEESNGHLPNYGANDGALFFPLSGSDYRDYRPQLDALHTILTGAPLYAENCEDAGWYGYGHGVSTRLFPPLERQYGAVEFPDGGYYLIREKDTLTFIRCGNHRDRPSQADNLHMDVWYRGSNVLSDAGSFKYNTDDETVGYFGGTRSHNTVMIGGCDQMRKGSRFVWYGWTQSLGAGIVDHDDSYVFRGAISAFTYLAKGITHERVVVKPKGKPEWRVTDRIAGKPRGAAVEQLWHTCYDNTLFQSDAVTEEKTGSFSSWFGHREDNRQIVLRTTADSIRTTISIEEEL